MIKKKTYIPSKPRNKNLSAGATTIAGVSKTEFNQVTGSSHEHPNKGVLDQITEAMLVGALRDLITSTDTETELTDENILSSLRVLSEIAKNNEAFLEDLKTRFLSKINPDTAQKLITFIEGIEVGAFTTGALGSGAAIKMIDGTSYAEVDNLTVRQKATFRELIIESLKHIGGQLVLTPARMKCVRVVEEDTFYKCYFDTGDGEVTNEFVAGDFARCQVFTGSGTKFYWRLVTLVGEDWINLSKTSAAVGSDTPEAGDDITQLGNATDTSRQSAIILSTVGIDAPSWKQYSGINSFSLEGKETTVFSKLGNRIQGKTVFTSGGEDLDDYLDGVAQDILDALKAAQDAEDKAQQAIEDAEANVATINTEVGKLQAQLDGEVSNWFYPYTPTLANYPASEWTTNVIKDRHVGDTFTNTAQAPATDAGKSWRFVKNGSTYSWTLIADSDAVKALLEASKAQATADGKSTTHLFKPTKYKLGDMWVLNADLTVNGTAYKQGEILTATQDSATYNQAHWIKRVRYTDDSAVNNLEIGGRNLIIDHKARIGYISLSNGEYTYSLNVNKDQSSDFIELEQEKKYTFSTYIIGEQVGNNVNRRLFFYDSDKVWLGNSFNLNFGGTSYRSMNTTFTPPIGARYIAIYISDGHLAGGGTRWKLEKGNKATDWTPAPEDVEAEIAGLGEYMEGTFEDGVIDKAEAKAIAEHLKTIGDRYVTDDALYYKLIDNPYLKGSARSTLQSVMQSEYRRDKPLLDTAINNIVSNGKVTTSLRNAFTTAFTNYTKSTKAFQEAVEEARKAIEEQRVDDIEIGSRNYLLDSNFNSDTRGGFQDVYGTSLSVANGILKSTVTEGGRQAVRVARGFYLNDTGTFTYSIKIKGTTSADVFRFQNLDGIIYSNKEYDITGDWQILHVTFRNEVVGEKRVLLYFPFADLGDVIEVDWDVVVKGNKPALDWTPAPEDVQDSIDAAQDTADDAAAEAADALAKANTSKAITDKFSGFDGGLATAVIMEMREPSTTTRGDVTAFISGMQGAQKNLPAFGAGGTYEEAILLVNFLHHLTSGTPAGQFDYQSAYSNLAPVIILHNGASKIGDFIVFENGTIVMIDPSTGTERLMFNVSDLPEISQLLSGVVSQGSTEIGSGNTSSSQTLSGSVNVTKAGASATFAGTNMFLSALGRRQDTGSSVMVAQLFLRRNGVRGSVITSRSIFFSEETNTPQTASIEIPEIAMQLTSTGLYTVELVVDVVGNVFNAYATTSSSTLSWKHTLQGVRRQQYGLNGMMFYYSNHHFYFTEGGGLDARSEIYNAWNMPGVLASGSVTAQGVQSNVWGAKSSSASASTISGGRSVPLSNMKHSNYVVQITPHTATTFRVGTKTTSSFQALGTGGFDYVVIGNNY